MWQIYTMEYYVAIKKDELMSFVGTWMNLEAIIFSKLTQEQKTKYRMFSLIGRCWTMRTYEHREGSITHWSLLEGLMEGQWGVGRFGRDNMGRNARYRWRGMEAANHLARNVLMQQSCMICTCTPESKVQLKKVKSQKTSLDFCSKEGPLQDLFLFDILPPA